jgi:hypothetical protein
MMKNASAKARIVTKRANMKTLISTTTYWSNLKIYPVSS